MTQTSHRCDCGAPAYRRDGSGWMCRECELFVAHIANLITGLIWYQRGGNMGQFTRREKRNEVMTATA